MKLLLPFLILFSTTLFFVNVGLSDEDQYSLILPQDENPGAILDDLVQGDTVIAVTTDRRDPRRDGCRIDLSFNGNQRFDNEQNARNFCDNFHNFFNVRNRCIVVRGFNANWDYSFSFTGRGDDWSSARRNVHQQYINHVFSRRYDRHRFNTNRSYPFTCDD